MEEPVRSTPSYVVRLARPDEAGQVCEVCTEGFTASSQGLLSPATIRRQVETYYTPERVRQDIVTAAEREAWQGYVVAVTDDGEVLGAAGGGVVSEGTGQIYALYLGMALRGRGIGSALVDFLTEQQKRLGAVEQGVSVTEGNDLGLPFYLAKGFVMKDRVPFVSDDEGNVEAWSLRLVRAI